MRENFTKHHHHHPYLNSESEDCTGLYLYCRQCRAIVRQGGQLEDGRKGVDLSVYLLCYKGSSPLHSSRPDSEAFLRSFHRFTTRRGLPLKIVLDNGSTFKSASRQIADLMKSSVVRQYLAVKKVKWIFNLEKAPWWGVLFERMVRSVKRCIKKTIGGARLTYEELLTVIIETEMIPNVRPLSYVTSVDAEKPLTPSHLLHGRRLMGLPDPCTGDLIDPDFELSSTELSKRMNHLSNVMIHFWRRWRDEYLIELRNSHRHSAKNAAPTPVAVGDIRVVHDEELPGVYGS